MAEVQTTASGVPPTSYKVLKEEVGTWVTVTDVDAHNSNAAIKAAVSKLAKSDQAGTFVAVPSRSWRPVSVEPKTTVQLELTEVKP